MAKIIKLESENARAAIKEIKTVLQKGGLIIYPTDTFYEIGGDATEPAVIERIKKIKDIGEEKPLSVMMADLQMIDDYCIVDFVEELILKKYLPGPYTFILNIHRPIAAATDTTLGVRVPETGFCNQICEEFGKPIVITSANKIGKKPPTKFSEIEKDILDNIELAIDGGQTKYGKAPTIIDLAQKKRNQTSMYSFL